MVCDHASKSELAECFAEVKEEGGAADRGTRSKALGQLTPPTNAEQHEHEESLKEEYSHAFAMDSPASYL
jgi:hypothetical protein